MRRSLTILIALAGIAGPALADPEAANAPPAAGDAAKGTRLFAARCASCHGFDPERRGPGPHLLSLIGRPAGSVEGYPYSKAMTAADFAWTVEKLDTFLANPQAFLPGTKMVVRVSVDGQRADIAAFLATKSE